MSDHTGYRPTAYLRSRYASILGERQRVTSALWDAQHPSHLRLADRIGDCCQTPHLHASADRGSIHLVEFRCRSRLCPICRHSIARRYMSTVLEHLHRMDSPRLLTLTLASSSDPLDLQLARLKGSFARLRRAKLWRDSVAGGVATIEITYNKRTRQWHPHLHAVIDGSFLKQQEVAAEWHRITGDSFIVDIRLVRSLADAARYIASYVGKSNDCARYPVEVLVEWIENVRSMRMLTTFGSHHGLKIEDPDTDLGPETSTDNPVMPYNRLLQARDDGDQQAAVLIAAINVQMLRQSREREGGLSEETQEQCRRLLLRLEAWDLRRMIERPSAAPARRDPALLPFYGEPP